MNLFRGNGTIIVLMICLYGITGCGSSFRQRETGKWKADRIETLKGFVSISVRTDERVSTAGGTIVYKRPGKMRIEILNFTGQAVATLVISDQKIFYYDRKENQQYQGEYSGAAMEKLTGLNMDLGSAEDMIVGGQILRGIEWQEKKDTNKTGVLETGGKTYRFTWNVEKDVLVKRECYENGILKEMLTCDDVHNFNGVNHPNRIVWEKPESGVKVEIKFRKKEINCMVDDNLFQVKIPATASMIQLVNHGE